MPPAGVDAPGAARESALARPAVESRRRPAAGRGRGLHRTAREVAGPPGSRRAAGASPRVARALDLRPPEGRARCTGLGARDRVPCDARRRRAARTAAARGPPAACRRPSRAGALFAISSNSARRLSARAASARSPRRPSRSPSLRGASPRARRPSARRPGRADSRASCQWRRDTTRPRTRVRDVAGCYRLPWGSRRGGSTRGPPVEWRHSSPGAALSCYTCEQHQRLTPQIPGSSAVAGHR